MVTIPDLTRGEGGFKEHNFGIGGHADINLYHRNPPSILLKEEVGSKEDGPVIWYLDWTGRSTELEKVTITEEGKSKVRTIAIRNPMDCVGIDHVTGIYYGSNWYF